MKIELIMRPRPQFAVPVPLPTPQPQFSASLGRGRLSEFAASSGAFTCHEEEDQFCHKALEDLQVTDIFFFNHFFQHKKKLVKKII